MLKIKGRFEWSRIPSSMALGSLCLMASLSAWSVETIHFPDEELASESVLPVFHPSISVKNRNVVTEGRVELGAYGGYSLNEPFFNPLSVGASITYHINEDHGINLFGLSYLQGTSNYSQQLNPIPGSSVNANLQYAPAPKYLALGSYQFTAYYGKISLSKDYVMNLGLYGLLGGGVMGIGDATKPVASIGLGQKFYFNPSVALRFDLRFLFYQGPDPVSKSLATKTDVQSANYFDEKMYIDGLLTFGAVFLLPQF